MCGSSCDESEPRPPGGRRSACSGAARRRQNPTRVEAHSFRPFGYGPVATLIAGAPCAVAGVLLANQSEFASPAFLTCRRRRELLVMVVPGGVGSQWGAMAGATGYLLVDQALSRFAATRPSMRGSVSSIASPSSRSCLLYTSDAADE